MKKSTLTVLLATAVMLVVTPMATAQQGAGTTVAVIDVPFIFKNHVRFKQAMEDIKKDVEGTEAKLLDERKSISQRVEQLRGLPSGSQEFKSLEESIANLTTQLKLEHSRKQKEILEREARVYYNAYKEIEQKVGMFADRYGISLVLRFNSEDMDPTKRESVLQGVNRAVVFQRKLNITQEILNELNRGTPTNGPPRTSSPPVPRRR